MGGVNISLLSKKEQEEIISLVKQQKKAKLEWISTITQVAKEEIINYANEMNLKIVGDEVTTNDNYKEIMIEKRKKLQITKMKYIVQNAPL